MNGQEEITSFHIWKHGVTTDILSKRSGLAESVTNTRDLHHVIENNPQQIKNKLKNDEKQENPESKAWRQGINIFCIIGNKTVNCIIFLVKLRMKNKNSTDDLKVMIITDLS